MAVATSTALAYGALAVTAAGTVASQQQQREAQDEQKKAAASDRAQARLRAARERRQQLRQARIARGEAINRAFISGGEGSTVSGATASAQTQAASNIGFINADLGASLYSNRQSQKASNKLGRAGLYQDVAGLASSFASFPSVFGGGGGGNNKAPITDKSTIFK